MRFWPRVCRVFRGALWVVRADSCVGFAELAPRSCEPVLWINPTRAARRLQHSIVECPRPRAPGLQGRSLACDGVPLVTLAS